MGYVAVKGGKKAIENSIEQLKFDRLKNKKSIDVEDIKSSMKALIDQIMSEASLYDRDLAAISIKQSEGNTEEATFLLRAYRSTLERKYYSNVVESSDMRIKRRISASFKEILGGQILGASYDYTHRLIDFDLVNENDEIAVKWIEDYESKNMINENLNTELKLRNIPKVINLLREEGLFQNSKKDNTMPIDITKENLEFPTKRSARLQILTRGQIGAVNSFAYAALRTAGIEHPTVGELRFGDMPIYINIYGDDYYIGDFSATEVESFIPFTREKKNGKKEINFKIGYGLVFGQNETKSISMSILDSCLNDKNNKFPTSDEEFVLLSIDSVESTGFLSHLKLPHYVTFQSELDSARKTKREEVRDEE